MDRRFTGCSMSDFSFEKHWQMWSIGNWSEQARDPMDFKMCISGKIHLTDLLWTRFSMASRYHNLEARKCLLFWIMSTIYHAVQIPWMQQDWSHARVLIILSMEDSTWKLCNLGSHHFRDSKEWLTSSLSFGDSWKSLNLMEITVACFLL